MTLKVDFSKFDKKLVDVVKAVETEAARAIRETAEQAIKTIVSRTRRKNQDKDGKRFKRYSEGYLKQRKEAGAGSKVVLTSPGRKQSKGSKLKGNQQGGTMLNSLTIIKVEDKGTKNIIGVARKKELIKLTGHVQGKGSLPVRNPMGFTKKEDEILSFRAARQIMVAIRRVGLR